MSSLQSQEQSLIIKFLHRVAPYSIIDAGLAGARAGQVIECVRLTNKIQGVVLEAHDSHETTAIEVISNQDLKATCSCSSMDEMHEQWCKHAVALLWRAAELGFLKANAGFAESEAAYRITSNAGQEAAAVIRSTAEMAGKSGGLQRLPHVRVELKPDNLRLALRLYVDDEEVVPAIFESTRVRSSRTVDNILVESINESALWDDKQKIWYIGSSPDLEKLFGLLQEYDDILLLPSRRAISFARELLDAELFVTWKKGGDLELALQWIMPDGMRRPKEEDLLGTGPYWVLLENSIYRLAPRAARLAGLFPEGAARRLKREHTGQIVEVLQNEEFDPEHVRVNNPELQPVIQSKSPTAVLQLSRSNEDSFTFSPFAVFEIEALLDFEYPAPPEDENVVYLPDRALERGQTSFLQALGFQYSVERRRFVARGDAALDLIAQGRKKFPPQWKIRGLEELQRAVRFSELSLTIELADKSDESQGHGNDPATVDCSIALHQNQALVPLSLLFRNESVFSEHWIRLDNGSFARVPSGSMSTLKLALGTIDPNFALSTSVRRRITPVQAIGLAGMASADVRVISDRKIKALAGRLQQFSGIGPEQAGSNFAGVLRRYQEDGLGWLLFLHKYDLAGILADEMGLGKTVQTLALLQVLADKRRRGQRRPNLVIAPTSVITNWYYEAQRFTPQLKTLLLHGADRKQYFEKLAEYDLILTSYALLRIDRYELARQEFGYLFLDEAQNIKNPEASTTKAAKHLLARHRLALTGTPVENRPLELWSIMDFLLPGYLGAYEFFKQQIEKPIAEGSGERALQLLKKKTRPFILRREKHDVEKDLPPKVESVLYVDMTPHQRELYLQVLEEVRPQVFAEVKKKGVRGATVSILAALMRLRQICNHPNSIRGLRHSGSYGSGKFNLLRDLTLEALQSGRKILLFSQFRGMLSIIREWLDEHEVKYLYLDGATKERAPLIERFNNDPAVQLFLISLKAGGTGINLTAADTVILYDPWWNPAVENQAVDRAHRIGQTKTVNVYRLVTEKSVEQKIMKLKEKKSKMADALINDDRLTTLNLSREDLESLFSPLK